MKKKAQDALGVAIIFACVAVFGLWSINVIGSNITKIEGYAANYINKECGTMLTPDEVRFQSEGSAVWYMSGPVRLSDCREVKGLVEIPRPGR